MSTAPKAVSLEYQGTYYIWFREPPSANRWLRNVGGRTVTSRAARQYKEHVANACLLHRVRPIPTPRPVRVTMIWHRARKAGDLDKRLGVLLDALQGHLYDCDAQVVMIHAERRDAIVGDPTAGRVVVMVEEVIRA